jgi:hypothetical protein
MPHKHHRLSLPFGKHVGKHLTQAWHPVPFLSGRGTTSSVHQEAPTRWKSFCHRLLFLCLFALVPSLLSSIMHIPLFQGRTDSKASPSPAKHDGDGGRTTDRACQNAHMHVFWGGLHRTSTFSRQWRYPGEMSRWRKDALAFSTQGRAPETGALQAQNSDPQY